MLIRYAIWYIFYVGNCGKKTIKFEKQLTGGGLSTKMHNASRIQFIVSLP